MKTHQRPLSLLKSQDTQAWYSCHSQKHRLEQQYHAHTALSCLYLRYKLHLSFYMKRTDFLYNKKFDKGIEHIFKNLYGLDDLELRIKKYNSITKKEIVL